MHSSHEPTALEQQIADGVIRMPEGLTGLQASITLEGLRLQVSRALRLTAAGERAFAALGEDARERLYAELRAQYEHESSFQAFEYAAVLAVRVHVHRLLGVDPSPDGA